MFCQGYPAIPQTSIHPFLRHEVVTLQEIGIITLRAPVFFLCIVCGLRSLEISERTVRRDWRKARAFLFSHLGEGELPEPW